MPESIGYGTQLRYSTDGVTYTTIARVTELGEFSFGEFDDVEITALDSPDRYREYMRGLGDGGEIEFTAIWTADPSQRDLIDRLLAAPSTLDYIQIVLPNGLGTFSCRGYIKASSINPQLDDRIEFSGTIKVSGKPQFTVP